MNQRRRANQVRDIYLGHLERIWPNILRAYDDFKDRKPVIEYRLREKLVLVFPAWPYIEDLTERTRKETHELYQQASENGRFMVFVSDSRKRVLRSYVFDIEEPARTRLTPKARKAT